MRDFYYSLINDLKWDSKIIRYHTAIHEAKGKQKLYLKQQHEKLNKLVEIAKVQSMESSNDRMLVIVMELKDNTLLNWMNQEIVGYKAEDVSKYRKISMRPFGTF